jgi:glycosyltransferase involved in cell wall biosynthesis
MRILIASQTYLPGTNGQAVFTIRLAEGLARAGHDVMAIVPSERGPAYLETIHGVQVFGVAALHLAWLHPATYFAPWPNPGVQQALAAFQPDLVHIQDHYPLCQSVLRAATAHGVPVVGTNHFLPENVIANVAPALMAHPRLRALVALGLWRMMLAVFNQLDAVTTPTETAAQILRRQAITRPVTAISCGVDTHIFHPRPELDRATIRRSWGLAADRPLFLYVGRVDHEKQIELVLRALSQLPHAGLQFGVVGRGSAMAELQALALQLGLDDRVAFLGYVPGPDLPVLLHSADVFVMPSPQELQSIATIEAMATGRPILAANARALPELVVSGINGYLFEPGQADSLAQGLARLLKDRSRWAALGQASLERAQKHSLTKTIYTYETLYRSVVAAYHPLAAHSIPLVEPSTILPPAHRSPRSPADSNPHTNAHTR